MYVESYQWQIGLERILILPLALCGFDTPYLSLPPLGIATMIPCTRGLSDPVARNICLSHFFDDLKERLCRFKIIWLSRLMVYKTNNNEACIGVKPEIGIEVIKTSYWRLKRGLMVPGGLLFLS